MIGAQLPLGLRLPATSRFDNYVAGANREAVAAVEQLARGNSAGTVFLAAAAGLGKTHLLQAACRAVEAAGDRSAYVPLRTLAEFDPAALEGLEHYALLAIDDVEAIAGRAAWEEALFHLYNRQRDAGGRLIGAASAPPEHLGLQLADLRTRLAWGGVYALQPVDDAMRLRILGLRARERGLELPDETAQFLLRRCPRDLPALLGLLERLDQAALASQRRLTVPFVRDVLGGELG